MKRLLQIFPWIFSALILGWKMLDYLVGKATWNEDYWTLISSIDSFFKKLTSIDDFWFQMVVVAWLFVSITWFAWDFSRPSAVKNGLEALQKQEVEKNYIWPDILDYYANLNQMTRDLGEDIKSTWPISYRDTLMSRWKGCSIYRKIDAINTQVDSIREIAQREFEISKTKDSSKPFSKSSLQSIESASPEIPDEAMKSIHDCYKNIDFAIELKADIITSHNNIMREFDRIIKKGL